MLERVSSLLQICRHYAVGSIPKASSSMEHIAIIDAILKGDTQLALESMKNHLERTRDALLDYVSQHPETTTPV